MRARGFALPEALVALSAGGLIVSVMLWLHVDYVNLSRRAMELGGAYAAGAELQRAVNLSADPCREQGAVLADTGDAVGLDRLDDAPPDRHQPGPRRRRHLAVQPLRRPGPPCAAAPPSPSPPPSAPTARRARLVHGLRPGRSRPVATVALRCDLAEVCEDQPAGCTLR